VVVVVVVEVVLAAGTAGRGGVVFVAGARAAVFGAGRAAGLPPLVDWVTVVDVVVVWAATGQPAPIAMHAADADIR
jgi:hypothetical protein